MNKQRKVMITTTYNEMGIIIDTNVEEVAQPNLQQTCNKLATDTISRQAAIDAVRNIIPDNRSIGICEELEQLPTIQPEPHKGHWEPVGMAEVVGGESAMWGSAIAYHECSECGEQALEEDGEEKLSDFCPHCGAKMKGEQNEGN